jgi:hypothetical protein
MQVEFDATLQDCVDVTKRSLERSNKFRREVFIGATKTALWLGLPPLIWPFWLFRTRIWVGIVGAALGAAIHLLTYRKRVEAELFKAWEKLLDGKERIRVEVNLSERGIAVSQMDAQNLYSWSMVSSLEETDDAIYFDKTDGLFLAVRTRAFAGKEEQRCFLEVARNYMAMARADSSSHVDS